MLGEKEKRIEAILFYSGNWIKLEDIAKISNLSINDVKKAIEKLKDVYARINSSITVLECNNLYKMDVDPSYENLLKNIAEVELEKPILRTLAIIAYYSPVSQSKVAKIRGNKAYEHIRKLEEMGFIKIEKKGRRRVIRVTDKFNKYFELEGDFKKIAKNQGKDIR